MMRQRVEGHRSRPHTGAATLPLEPTSAASSHHQPSATRANIDLVQRNLPSRGLFRPGPLIAGGSLLMLFGWYKLATGIREQKYVQQFSLHASLPLDSHRITASLLKSPC